jgi:hypothetical protein
MYKELMELDEVASACKVKKLVMEVDYELKKAERYWLNKEAMGWDMTAIVEEQKKKHDKYKKKMEKIGVHIC